MAVPHRVVALVVPDVVAFDLSIAAQIFGHPAEAERYSFAVCAEQPGDVPSTTGFPIGVRDGLDQLDTADTVIVPGFRPLVDPSPAVCAALQRAAARGARVASVCIGAFALAAAGLLDGRVATTHWEEADAFRKRFPHVPMNPDVLYVDAGPILTSAGLSAGIDLCLHMVRQDYGADAAATVARRMVVAMHRPGGQMQYARRPPAESDRLAETCDWAVREMHRAVTVNHLARRAGMSARTFARQFREATGMTPMRWLTVQRLLEAQRLLEVTTLSVDEIAGRCGIGSAANLRLHMSREFGATPSAYRRERRAGAGRGRAGSPGA
ncbi:helix-turn-helix domain-containing protein [Actinoplanes sp. NPDC049596]|uniref:GlxA family transcriptional regulator n=1 Tax=unclassified Actinoplanes TaxID=2626549 RepID=UPI003432C1AD